MAAKRRELKNIANIISILTVIILAASSIFEIQIAGITVNAFLLGVVIVLTLLSVVIVQKNPITYKLEITVPLLLFIFYTLVMIIGGWYNSGYLLVCLLFCAISCVYSNFSRTIIFVVIKNIVIGFLIIRGYPIRGIGSPLYSVLIDWTVYISSNILIILLTKYATIHLNKALEYQNSFMNLLVTTENYIAMLNKQNEVVYASKTLSQLANCGDPAMVQGRPLLDLFPEKTLKIYAGKMLKERKNYAEDWEFTLNGQKQYFKAASHSLPGGNDVLINLYDMTHLAERDEIAVMKDNMKIGLFFIDPNFIIQDHYSQYLEEMLEETNLFGRVFTEILESSVSANELGAIKDYLGMVMERTYDQEMLDDINPLNELRFTNNEVRKVFQFAFAPVERGRGETFLLVTVYDITARVELQERLAEEEARRQEEMEAVFELIKVEPDVFSEFMKDMEHEFSNIEKVQQSETLSSHEALVKIYQSVHAIKSNAVILGLNVFGKKVHNLESKIKVLREKEGEVPFSDMLNLAVDIEKIFNEKEGFKDIIDKLHAYVRTEGGGAGSGKSEKNETKTLIDSLTKSAAKAAEDTGKLIKFIANDVDAEAVEKGPKRDVKEILIQLIRNSAVHGIELPEVRKANGKRETGIIKLSINMSADQKHIHIKLADDGKGLDYKKIAERALSRNLIKEEEANNTDVLIKTIFSPGFSTAETEGMHAGRGIGLNLVRDRLKDIKGSVKVRSEAGKGIVFLVSVPVEKEFLPK